MLFNQDRDSSKINKSQKGVIRFVIACCHTPNPFDFLEEAFDQMALLVKPPITVTLDNPIGLRWNNRSSSPLFKIIQNSIGIECSVSQDVATLNLNLIKQFNGMGGVVVISRRQKELYCITQPVNYGMDFCV